MRTYHEICQDMASRGPYLTDPIGKCQRHIRAFQGEGPSRIDKYLAESATYAASVAKRCLADEFDDANAISAVLEWIEARKSGARNQFPVLVDEKNGIVKQPNRQAYGLLEDVVGCLFRKTQDDQLIPWEDSRGPANEAWVDPSQEEIARADDSLSVFGTATSRRFWQAQWRLRVERLWGTACIVTGCKDRRLLRGAHIKRVAPSTTKERLDEYNGLILVAHVDLAFEHGLITFADSGKMLFSPTFSVQDRDVLHFPAGAKLPIVPEQTRKYLQWHRDFHGFQANA